MTDFQNGLIMGLANSAIITTGADLPDVTEEDNGKTLSVIDGTWAADKQIIEVTKAEYDALGDTVKTDGKLYFIKDWTQPYAMNGKGMVSKVLWSGKQQTTGTITLNDSVDNYDLIVIKTSRSNNSDFVGSYQYCLSSDIIIGINNQYHVDYSLPDDHPYDCRATYGFNNLNVLEISTISNNASAHFTITKIIGLRFCAATCCYSTDEQIVGQWIDGKPIYQKTIINENSDGFSTSTNISMFSLLSNLNIETILNYELLGQYRKGTYETFPHNSPEDSADSIIVWNSGKGVRLGSNYTPSSEWGIIKIIGTYNYTKTTD